MTLISMLCKNKITIFRTMNNTLKLGTFWTLLMWKIFFSEFSWNLQEFILFERYYSSRHVKGDQLRGFFQLKKSMENSIGQSLLLFCKTILYIYFLKIIPFKSWPQLRFNSSIRSIQFSMIRSSITAGISWMTRVILASNASIVAGLFTKTMDFT